MRCTIPLLALLLALLLPPLLPVLVSYPSAVADEGAAADRERTDLRWLVRTLRFALERERRGARKEGKVGVYLGRGVFPPSGIAVVRRLDEMGTPPRLLFSGDVTTKGLAGLRRIVVPGGWAPSQLEGLGKDGRESLVEFVEGGGRYFGICAGSYLPCTYVRWQGRTSPYSVGLVRGTASGPVAGRTAWPTSEVLDLDLEKGGRRRVLYAGGPTFDVKGAEVLARYPGGEAAVIEVMCGKGRILLSGAHVEFSTRHDADLLTEGGWATGLDPGDAKLFAKFLRRLR